MNIFITGGAGFIGSHLAEYHLKKNDAVWVLDDLSTGTYENIRSFQDNPNFQFEEGDILTWNRLEEIVKWADRIYHMAAVVGVFRVLKDPLRVLSVNTSGCVRLLEVVHQVGKKNRVIVASSSEVYGPSQKNLNEADNLIIESHASCRWNYPVSKLSDEAYSLSYHQQCHLPITIVRLFNTIGLRQSGQYGMVVPRFIKQAIQNEPIRVFGSGNQTRSFCDIRDTVVFLDQLAHTERSIGEIVNVGNDNEITINLLAEKIKRISNSHSSIQHISYQEAYGVEYIDIPKRRPDLSKLFQLIEYRPQWDIDQSLDYLIHNN